MWMIIKPPGHGSPECFKSREDAEKRKAELEAENPKLVDAFLFVESGFHPRAIRAAAGEGPGPSPEDRW
jgi:hypothetical protein